MAAGQNVRVLVCAANPPSGGAIVANLSSPNMPLLIGDSTSFFPGPCPENQSAYSVPAYLPFSESGGLIDGWAQPFDPAQAGGLFSFGFGVVVFFYLLGLKGSVLIRPFWSGWH